eukprot:15431999-Alexandrium_andersonii.AAC.1
MLKVGGEENANNAIRRKITVSNHAAGLELYFAIGSSETASKDTKSESSKLITKGAQKALEDPSLFGRVQFNL